MGKVKDKHNRKRSDKLKDRRLSKLKGKKRDRRPSSVKSRATKPASQKHVERNDLAQQVRDLESQLAVANDRLAHGKELVREYAEHSAKTRKAEVRTLNEHAARFLADTAPVIV